MDSDLQPRVVSGPTAVAEIQALRCQVWQPLMPAEMSPQQLDSLLNEEPNNSVYWAVRNERMQIIASARFSIHERASDVLHTRHFPSLAKISISTPFGWISRLVIHERYRGLGLSRKFDVLRQQHASASGCTALIAFARGDRLRSLCAKGWKLVGPGEFSPTHPIHALGQHLIVKSL